jgi:hypothetical protein
MSYEVSNLSRLRIKSESTFGTDDTSGGSSISAHLEVPHTAGTFSHGRDQARLEPNTSKQWKDDKDFTELGPKTCAPSWDMLLHSHGVTIDGDVTGPYSADWGQALLFKSMMGGESVETPEGAQTTVAAGSSATVINVLAGHGSRFLAGRTIGVVINGRYEVRPIMSVSTDAVTVKVAFSGTPANGSVVISGPTYYLTNTTAGDTLQIVHEGQETSHRFGYNGCVGGFSLRMGNGELLGMSLSMQGATWTKFSTGTLGRATHTYYNPVTVKDSEFIVGTVGSTTRTLVHCSSREWTPNINYAPIRSSAGVETIVGWERTHSPPAISGTITPYWDQSGFDFHAAAIAGTELCFIQQFGTAAGGIVLLEAPSVQVWIPSEGDVDGLLSQPVQWWGRCDASISGATSELGLSAFRISFL